MISVIVPVYNQENYLERSVSSLLCQTYRDFEVILVDDGSTDESPIICDRFAEENPNVRVFHKKNGGEASARNYGMDQARGELLAAMDPDDWVEPNFLQTLVELYERGQSDLEICGHIVEEGGRAMVWNANGGEILMRREEALTALLRRGLFCGYAWNKLYHMDIIRKNELRFDESLHYMPDLHFAYRYIACCRSILYNIKPVYHYDRESGGITTSSAPLTARKLTGFDALKKIVDLAKGNCPPAEAAACSSLFNISMSMMYEYFRANTKDPQILKMLRANLWKYRKWFFSDSWHSRKHKLLGSVAMVSPKMYYLCSKVLRGDTGSRGKGR